MNPSSVADVRNLVYCHKRFAHEHGVQTSDHGAWLASRGPSKQKLESPDFVEDGFDPSLVIGEVERAGINDAPHKCRWIGTYVHILTEHVGNHKFGKLRGVKGMRQDLRCLA